MPRKRTDAVRRAQSAYEADKLAAGQHVQVNLKLKAQADVALMKQLRERFPDMTDAAIARMALRELGKLEN